jgi:hypothetical protein
MHPYLSQALAAERRRQLAAEAAGERFASQAVLCRPGLLARFVARTRTARARLTRAGSTVCCVPSSAPC